MNELHNRIYEAFDEETDDIEIIESGEWENEFKDYDTKESIVKFEGKYYSVVEARKIETVVITKWVAKK